MCKFLKIIYFCAFISTFTYSADPFNQNQKLGRGINLGNALEAEGYEGAWGVVLQEEYFIKIKEAGFNSVRIPISWTTGGRTPTTPPYAISNTFFQRVDWAIKNALSNGLMVIIDVHHYYEIFENPYTEKARFLAIWNQIANRYKNYSDSLIFELLNEPNTNLTSSIWNEFLADAISTIRATNPNRTLIVGPAEWGKLNALNALIIPAGEDNVIVTVHYYEPMSFTHQGAEWHTPYYPVGTPWKGTAAERLVVTNHFDVISTWAANRNVPIFMGEFGAYEKADMASRILWTDCIARTSESNNFAWAYWEFCSSFGIYDPGTGTFKPGLLGALMPAVPPFTVTINQPLNGTISISPVKQTYSMGELVTLTAQPNTGFEFNAWTGDITGNTNPYKLAVYDNYSFSCDFNSTAKLIISPSDSDIGSTQKFDFMLFLKNCAGNSVTELKIFYDSNDITASVLMGANYGLLLLDDGVCLRVGGVSGSVLGTPGKHTVTVEATLSNNVVITETADWNIVSVD